MYGIEDRAASQKSPHSLSTGANHEPDELHGGRRFGAYDTEDAEFLELN